MVSRTKCINQCQKGKRVERELVNWFKERNIPDAKRTEQYSGDTGDSDVEAPESLPSFFIESKGTKSATLGKAKIKAWVKTAVAQCSSHQIPVIFHRADNYDWLGILPAEVFFVLTDTTFAVDYELFVAQGSSVTPAPIFAIKAHNEKVYKALRAKSNTLPLIVGFETGEESVVVIMEADLLLELMLNLEAIRKDADITEKQVH